MQKTPPRPASGRGGRGVRGAQRFAAPTAFDRGSEVIQHSDCNARVLIPPGTQIICEGLAGWPVAGWLTEGCQATEAALHSAGADR